DVELFATVMACMQRLHSAWENKRTASFKQKPYIPDFSAFEVLHGMKWNEDLSMNGLHLVILMVEEFTQTLGLKFSSEFLRDIKVVSEIPRTVWNLKEYWQKVDVIFETTSRQLFGLFKKSPQFVESFGKSAFTLSPEEEK